MLRSLRIKNLALIENADISFAAGLTVVTGESGAGKSLLVRALTLALGERADRDDVGKYATQLSVEAEFELLKSAGLIALLTTLDIPVESAKGEPVSLTLRRELSAVGKSRAFVNDSLLGLAEVRAVAQAICKVVSQSASVSLRDESEQLTALDRFARLTDRVSQLGATYDSWHATKRALADVESNRDRLAAERELSAFQLDELIRAHLREGEEEELAIEKKRLDNAERLLGNCHTLIAGIDGDESPLTALREMRKIASDIARDDTSFAPHRDTLESATIALGELSRDIEQYRANLTVDERRLEELNSRLAELYKIRKKYGGPISDAIAKRDTLKDQLGDGGDIEGAIRRLASEETALRTTYTTQALAIRKTRQSAAQKLSSAVRTELSAVAISRARFDFMFNWEPDENGVAAPGRDGQVVFIRPERHGLECGCFYFSANPGEDPKPLGRVASGGELSRALLALEIAMSDPAERALMTHLFDEIDAGIGGATATAVGKKLAELAHGSQVIVVTHLRQVAQCANHHIVVEKTTERGRSVVTVRELRPSEAKQELLKMVDLPVKA